MITGSYRVFSAPPFFPVSADPIAVSLADWEARGRAEQPPLISISAEHCNPLCELIKHVNGPLGGAGGRAEPVCFSQPLLPDVYLSQVSVCLF